LAAGRPRETELIAAAEAGGGEDWSAWPSMGSIAGPLLDLAHGEKVTTFFITASVSGIVL